MLEFKIDQEKCIKCGLCVNECPVSIIALKDFPVIKDNKENTCLKCQHCLAVCPTSALSILGKNPKDSISLGELPEHDKMVRLIKTRRTIRKYANKEVNKELLYNILDTALYAPTSHNKNSIIFNVIDNRERLNKFKELTYNTIKKHEENGTIPEKYLYVTKFQKVWEKKGIDILFRDAPHLLIASTSNATNLPKTDGTIALSYFELLANTNNIGTLWDGFLYWVFKYVAPELLEELGIPKDHSICMPLLFGYSVTKYKRSIQLEGEHINTIK